MKTFSGSNFHRIFKIMILTTIFTSSIVFYPYVTASPSLRCKIGFEENEESGAYTLGDLAGQGYNLVAGTDNSYVGWLPSNKLPNHAGRIVTSGDGILPLEGMQMLELSRPNSANGNEFRNTFLSDVDRIRGDLVFRFNIAVDSESNAAMGVGIGPTGFTGGAYISIRRNGGVGTGYGIYYRSGSTSENYRIGTTVINLKEFYEIETFTHLEEQTYDISVKNSSGSLLERIENIPIYIPDSRYSTISEYSCIYGFIDQIGTTKFYIDEIMVEEYPTWKAVILPASLNEDKTIKLISDSTQHLSLGIQANKLITENSSVHNTTIELDFPKGIDIMSNSGELTLAEIDRTITNTRNIISYNATINNSAIIGEPGSRILSLVPHSLFVNTEALIPAEESYLNIRIVNDERIQSFFWPITISPHTIPHAYPTRSSIGLWSYGFRRANGSAANGIAQFLANSGISFIQSVIDSNLHAALNSNGIRNGGQVHQSLFYSSAAKDKDVDGNFILSDFPDPQAIINLPPNDLIPGVNELLINASLDGYATYDYEPNGALGFSELSINTFKNIYNVSNSKFTDFQNMILSKGYENMYNTENTEIRDIWDKWTEFRTMQSDAYTERIYSSVKESNSNSIIALTTLHNYSYESSGASARGVNSVPMARNADIIMPQLYYGYDEVGVKLTIQSVRKWKQEMSDNDINVELWPILLVRHVGASVFNAPERIYQQSVGAIANGATGVLYFYPEQMDAPYWNILARLNETLAKYEDYYLDGARVDSYFPISGLPIRTEEYTMTTGYTEFVDNPDWMFTAHSLNGKALLTLMNLSSFPQTFTIGGISDTNISYENTNPLGNDLTKWSVAAGETAYVLFDWKIPDIIYRSSFEQNEIFINGQNLAYKLEDLAGQGYRLIEGSNNLYTGWLPSNKLPNHTGQVVLSGSEISAPDGAQMLELSRPSVSDGDEFRNTFLSDIDRLQQDFLFRFKVAVDVESNAAMGVGIGPAGFTGGAYISIRRNGGVGSGFGIYFRSGETNQNYRIGTTVLTLKEFYDIDIQLNWEDQTFNVLVHDSSGNLLEQVEDIPVYLPDSRYSSVPGYNRIFGRIDQIGVTKFYLDKIIVEK